MTGMRAPSHILAVLALGAALLAPADPQAARADGDDGGGDDVPECVEYWGEARPSGYGYNHVVHVDNDCEQLAKCKVWTDVNTDKQRVDVPAGREKEVVTFVASPSREFEAHAQCTLEE
ncbi:MAG: hypothetical protein ACOCUS_06670 [Polyangiales bacterium]